MSFIWKLLLANLGTFLRTKSTRGFSGTSLVIQWLRIHLAMQGTQQGTQVRSLGWKDPTWHGATKPLPWSLRATTRAHN